MKLENTNTYDLVVCVVIGVLLRFSYSLGNDLKTIRDQLSKEDQAHMNQLFELTEKLGNINAWRQEINNNEPVEDPRTEDPESTTRDVRGFKIKIPRQ